ncbi:MAG: cbb3-type cytochrome c oxidase N-terminal domain-containing protein [Flavitalea sp.]
MFKHLNKYKTRLIMTAIAVIGLASEVWAAGPPKTSSMENPVVITLVIVMSVLLLVIMLLSNILLGTAGYLREKEKEQELAAAGSGSSANPAGSPMKAIISSIVAIVLFTLPTFAQDAPAAQAAVKVSTTIAGLGKTTFYLLISVIGIEVTVILFMLLQLKSMLAKQKVAALVVAREEVVATEFKPVKKTKKLASLWNRLNSFRPLEQEAAIELDHNYDGIRELDNRLPPWWLYGFYLTIIFAGVYLWRYHISETAPLQEEELQIAMQQAEVQKAEYLKKSANNIDENTVKYLAETSDLDAGKKVYEASCTPCHGKAGEGVVGPNLTDEYWVHGGSMPDVFKSIKYGWPDKGMRAWKDDFSPKQLAQLTSYIKSLSGTNPPNAKAPEGNIYKEEGESPATSADSTVMKVAVK